MENLAVYTDGACLGNPGPGGWGVRILYPDRTVQELGGGAAYTTNNRMELQAAIAALEAIQSAAQATLYTDSRYVLDGLTRWLTLWRQRDWLTRDSTPVKNQDLWQHLASLQRPGFRWRHVRGHQGDPQNERVDRIARAFAMGQFPALYCGPVGAPDDPVSLAPTETIAPSQAPAVAAPATRPVRYVSLIDGAIVLDTEWAACAARVHKVASARYRKIRTLQELQAFCHEHGIALPPES